METFSALVTSCEENPPVVETLWHSLQDNVLYMIFKAPIPKLWLKFTYLRSQPCLPGDYELIIYFLLSVQ